MKEIENALIVPLIQGVIFSARGNELHYKKKSSQEFYPEVRCNVAQLHGQCDSFIVFILKYVVIFVVTLILGLRLSTIHPPDYL